MLEPCSGVNENVARQNVCGRFVELRSTGLREGRHVDDVRGTGLLLPLVAVGTSQTLGKDAGSGFTLGASRWAAGLS